MKDIYAIAGIFLLLVIYSINKKIGGLLIVIITLSMLLKIEKV